jgi:hypothetical protein
MDNDAECIACSGISEKPHLKMNDLKIQAIWLNKPINDERSGRNFFHKRAGYSILIGMGT